MGDPAEFEYVDMGENEGYIWREHITWLTLYPCMRNENEFAICTSYSNFIPNLIFCFFFSRTIASFGRTLVEQSADVSLNSSTETSWMLRRTIPPLLSWFCSSWLIVVLISM